MGLCPLSRRRQLPGLNGIDGMLRRLVAGLGVIGRDIMILEKGDVPGAEALSDRGRRRSPRVAAVVLAAGRSERMGEINKLLIKLGDREMVAHGADNALASRARPVVVVTGHQAALVAAALGDRPVMTVHNFEFRQGMASSLRTGVAALSPEVDAALICLGDMPLVGPAMLDRLIVAYAAGEGDICVPKFGQRRGNPVLWDRRYFAEFAELVGDEGARRLLLRHAAAVAEVVMDDAAVVTDVDTSEAAALMARGWVA